MNILVYVRPYPGWDKLRFNLSSATVEVPAAAPTGLAAFGEGSWLLNPSDRAALDVAGRLADRDPSGGTRITAVALATEPADAAEAALREALARGAGHALLVTGVVEADAFLTAGVLSALVRRPSPAAAYDLVLTGASTPAGAPDEAAAMTAEDLGWPFVDEATALELPDAAGRLQAQTVGATLAAALPAVVTVVPDPMLTPRYPAGGAVLAAFRQARIESLSLEDLGDPDPAAGPPTARVRVRRAVLGEAPASERLAGPVDESVAALVQALQQILS